MPGTRSRTRKSPPEAERCDTLVESIIKRADTVPYSLIDEDISPDSASLYDLVEGVADSNDDEPPSEIRLRVSQPPADCLEWAKAEAEASAGEPRRARKAPRRAK